ncbi:peroxisomal biogenesis factor 11 [Aspergillus varians]
MAQAVASPGISPLQQLFTFTRQTAGVEKTLRLVQAVSQIVGVISDNEILATQCMMARDQLALARRYIRFLDFYSCFARVHDLLASPSSTGTILSVMELAQYTFLGLFRLLEDFTILHDSNIARVEWARPLMIEANKFWFYSLALSIMRVTWELFFPIVAPSRTTSSSDKASTPGKDGDGDGDSDSTMQKKTEQQQQQQQSPPKWPLIKQIIISGCDLTQPGSFIRWVPATGLQIGLGMVVSTILSGHDVWLAQQ